VETLEFVLVIDTDTLVLVKKDEKTDQQIFLQKKLEQSTRIGSAEEDTFEDELFIDQDNMFNVLTFKRRQIEKRGPIMPIEEIYPHYVKAALESRQKYNPTAVNVTSDWIDDDTSTATEQDASDPSTTPPTSPNGHGPTESKQKHFSFTVQCQFGQTKKKELKPYAKVQFLVNSEKDQQQWTSVLTEAILNEESRKDLRDPQEEVLKKIQPFSDFFYLLTGDEKSGIDGPTIVNCFNSITLSVAEKMVVPLLTVFDTIGARCSSVDLIKSAISAEIANASSAGTLFRRNSLSSKLVTLFFKLYGLDYLRQSVGAVIKKIIRENKNYEIDDGRVQGASKQKIVEENGRVLSDLVQTVIDRIVSRSATHAPHEIRLILSHSLVETRKRFPDSGEICVGGLLFLRFFCPAILTPQQFGLVRENMAPPANALRTLTLLTKALQNIANQINVVDNKKEAFMSRLQNVMETNIDPLKSFFGDIATYKPLEVAESGIASPNASFRTITLLSGSIIPDTMKLKCLTLLNYFFQEAFAKKMFKPEKDEDNEIRIAYLRFAETLSLMSTEDMEKQVKELRDAAPKPEPIPEPVVVPEPIVQEPVAPEPQPEPVQEPVVPEPVAVVPTPEPVAPEPVVQEPVAVVPAPEPEPEPVSIPEPVPVETPQEPVVVPEVTHVETKPEEQPPTPKEETEPAVTSQLTLELEGRQQMDPSPTTSPVTAETPLESGATSPFPKQAKIIRRPTISRGISPMDPNTQVRTTNIRSRPSSPVVVPANNGDEALLSTSAPVGTSAIPKKVVLKKRFAPSKMMTPSTPPPVTTTIDPQ
jgi:hypothetical protein